MNEMGKDFWRESAEHMTRHWIARASEASLRAFGVDVPMRIYWFPTRHVSIHTEFGLAFGMGADDAVIFNFSEGDIRLAPQGLAIVAFRNSSPFSLVGMTYWW